MNAMALWLINLSSFSLSLCHCLFLFLCVSLLSLSPFLLLTLSLSPLLLSFSVSLSFLTIVLTVCTFKGLDSDSVLDSGWIVLVQPYIYHISSIPTVSAERKLSLWIEVPFTLPDLIQVLNSHILRLVEQSREVEHGNLLEHLKVEGMECESRFGGIIGEMVREGSVRAGNINGWKTCLRNKGAVHTNCFCMTGPHMPVHSCKIEKTSSGIQAIIAEQWILLCTNSEFPHGFCGHHTTQMM